ncbi:uncharacterized protein LOC129218991 [Uloborus diversus]|uniref:uncharacterized protein LOC129218991 n=1 Tax=Uloborus diversus TaxID=327109 RepID=UPI00240A67A1|nr:uncharacterized protein LOC129218991 [Uloborus diversus]
MNDPVPLSKDKINSDAILTSIIPHKNKVENNKQIVLLQTFKAIISDSEGETKIHCRGLIDSGSQRSFIHERLVNKLKLPVVDREKISLHTFRNSTAINVIRHRVKFLLHNISDENKCLSIAALESPEICNTLIETQNKDLREQIQSLGIKLSDSENGYSDSKIDILIWSDYFWEIVSGTTRRINEKVMLLDTLMGWTIHGPISNFDLNFKTSSVEVLSAIVTKDLDDELTNQLIAFWELESLGIQNDPSKRAISDGEALQKFEKTLTFKNGRYVVALPWKHENDNLASNYDNARKRLNSLIRRFYKDPSLYIEYKAVIDEYFKLGSVEEVSDTRNTGHPTYYLPLSPVIRKDKSTTKLRIVFDASSHPPHAPSLNDLLHSGPNLNPDLLNLILSFRFHRIGFVADIEKAFLNIGLSENDRDVVRFL